MRFPIGLWQHWRRCEWDGCDLCYQFLKYRKEYNKNHKDQIVETTLLDLTGSRT